MAVNELDTTPVYTPYVAGYGRKKTSDGLTINEYATLKRYYSSIDAEVYLGNEYVEDVCDITWNVVQKNLPLYGFNSYTYDEIAIGSRLIQGQFSIRFTNPNYLFKVLERAKELAVTKMSAYTIPPHTRVIGQAQGTPDKTLSGETTGTNSAPLWKNSFDIDVVFGKPTRGSEELHVVLQDVHILTCVNGATVNSPVPITETYQFVAKDIKTLSPENRSK